MRTQAGTQCKREGRKGKVGMIITHDKKRHPITGAYVRVVTNRLSGLLVELVSEHNGYSKGEQVIIAEADFIADSPVTMVLVNGVH